MADDWAHRDEQGRQEPKFQATAIKHGEQNGQPVSVGIIGQHGIPYKAIEMQFEKCKGSPLERQGDTPSE
jgi:hypothetical protein